ncbi:hypothetical protein HUU62_20550 [Rhodoferax sp. 4810]|nr:hypothetical protein [Rhodoferax jenense]
MGTASNLCIKNHSSPYSIRADSYSKHSIEVKPTAVWLGAGLLLWYAGSALLAAWQAPLAHP